MRTVIAAVAAAMLVAAAGAAHAGNSNMRSTVRPSRRRPWACPSRSSTATTASNCATPVPARWWSATTRSSRTRGCSPTARCRSTATPGLLPQRRPLRADRRAEGPPAEPSGPWSTARALPVARPPDALDEQVPAAAGHRQGPAHAHLRLERPADRGRRRGAISGSLDLGPAARRLGADGLIWASARCSSRCCSRCSCSGAAAGRPPAARSRRRRGDPPARPRVALGLVLALLPVSPRGPRAARGHGARARGGGRDRAGAGRAALQRARGDRVRRGPGVRRHGRAGRGRPPVAPRRHREPGGGQAAPRHQGRGIHRDLPGRLGRLPSGERRLRLQRRLGGRARHGWRTCSARTGPAP